MILAFSFSIVLILAIFGAEKSNSEKPIFSFLSGLSNSTMCSCISLSCCSNFSVGVKASNSSGVKSLTD